MHNGVYEKDQAARLREMARTGNGKETNPPVVMTVTSGKGGVGKSTVALNLAITLCDHGKNVFLFDADANLANLDIMLGISPEHRLGNVLRGELSVAEAVTKPYNRLTFLAGSSGDARYPHIDGSIQEYILNQITTAGDNPDYIVLDTSAGLNKEVVNYSLFSDESIIITSPEPTSVMDAYAMIKIISLSKPDHRFRLIINSVKSQKEADETARKLQMVLSHFLHIAAEYIGNIPYDENVIQAISRQDVLVKKYPRSRASMSIHRIARKIVYEKQTVNIRRVAHV
jgi:flagellar biosynthesis protein FlhG